VQSHWVRLFLWLQKGRFFRNTNVGFLNSSGFLRKYFFAPQILLFFVVRIIGKHRLCVLGHPFGKCDLRKRISAQNTINILYKKAWIIQVYQNMIKMGFWFVPGIIYDVFVVIVHVLVDFFLKKQAFFAQFLLFLLHFLFFLRRQIRGLKLHKFALKSTRLLEF
jgi:hypothetical protein